MSLERSPYFLLAGFCLTRLLVHLTLQNYQPLIPVLQKEWACSMLGLAALIGIWAMVKLRSMPESLKMAGGKK